jgi:hypothetical protein
MTRDCDNPIPTMKKVRCRSGSSSLLAVPRDSRSPPGEIETRVIEGNFGQQFAPLLRFAAEDIVFDELHMLLRILDRCVAILFFRMC